MGKVSVGGQAVLEGIMMRAPGIMTVAVRRQDGSIAVHTDRINVPRRWLWMRKPFLRGVLALVQSLVLGFKALNYSSAVAVADIDSDATRPNGSGEGESRLEERGGLSGWSVAGILGLTLILGIGFFFMLPLFLTEILAGSFSLIAENTVFYNIIDGIIRVFIFLLYIAGITLLPDIRRLFQYHGAEHKSIFTYEAGLPLTVENARGFSTLHPRCGTAFLLVVMVVAVFVFSLVPSGMPVWIKVASRIVLLPVIAGVSFELIRKAGESGNRFFRLVILPGIWLQRITTREPDESQLEVGLKALETALTKTQDSAADIII
ncbi:DUF1385 domain-containing protein [bacterium]|nr:DUF1385 domain-containing protein [candidate division CSSED10-310 bacterium]